MPKINGVFFILFWRKRTSNSYALCFDCRTATCIRFFVWCRDAYVSALHCRLASLSFSLAYTFSSLIRTFRFSISGHILSFTHFTCASECPVIFLDKIMAENQQKTNRNFVSIHILTYVYMHTHTHYEYKAYKCAATFLGRKKKHTHRLLLLSVNACMHWTAIFAAV